MMGTAKIDRVQAFVVIVWAYTYPGQEVEHNLTHVVQHSLQGCVHGIRALLRLQQGGKINLFKRRRDIVFPCILTLQA
jgi:hypothetical protein